MRDITKDLNGVAIPKGIQTIPIKNFNKNVHFFLLHDMSYISDCVAIDEIQEKHIKSNKTIMLINDFKKKFGEKINKFFKNK